MAGFRLTGDALNERDEFTEKLTPELIGECAKGADNIGHWCVQHEAHWPPQMTVCTHARDMEDFADRLIEAWEGRDRG